MNPLDVFAAVASVWKATPDHDPRMILREEMRAMPGVTVFSGSIGDARVSFVLSDRDAARLQAGAFDAALVLLVKRAQRALLRQVAKAA